MVWYEAVMWVAMSAAERETAAGNWRKSESVVYTYVPEPNGATRMAPSLGGSPVSFIDSMVR